MDKEKFLPEVQAVKCRLEEGGTSETRLVMLSRRELNELHSKLSWLFNLRGYYQLRYLDKFGDLITFSSEEEFQLALASHQQPEFRVLVTPIESRFALQSNGDCAPAKCLIGTTPDSTTATIRHPSDTLAPAKRTVDFSKSVKGASDTATDTKTATELTTHAKHVTDLTAPVKQVTDLTAPVKHTTDITAPVKHTTDITAPVKPAKEQNAPANRDSDFPAPAKSGIELPMPVTVHAKGSTEVPKTQTKTVTDPVKSITTVKSFGKWGTDSNSSSTVRGVTDLRPAIKTAGGNRAVVKFSQPSGGGSTADSLAEREDHGWKSIFHPDYLKPRASTTRRVVGRRRPALDMQPVPASSGRQRLDGEDFVHHGITCSRCGAEPLIGWRFTCSQCANYNLCSLCFEVYSHGHGFYRLP